jgi:hypothetical protein
MEALAGHMEEHHAFMIKASLEHMKAIEEILSTLERKIAETVELHHKEEYELLKAIPSIPLVVLSSVISRSCCHLTSKLKGRDRLILFSTCRG